MGLTPTVIFSPVSEILEEKKEKKRTQTSIEVGKFRYLGQRS